MNNLSAFSPATRSAWNRLASPPGATGPRPLRYPAQQPNAFVDRLRTPQQTAPYGSRGLTGTLGASRGSAGGRYSPPSAGGGYGGLDGFFGGPGPTAGFAAPVAMNRPGYGQPAMPESSMARYLFGDQEVGPMLGRVPIGPGMQVPGGGSPGNAEALKAAYMRRRDDQFLNPVNPNQERMAQLTGVPLSESLAYARANMQPVARGTIPSVGSSNPSLASVNNINGQLLTDPTNIQAQFSSQLGQPSADESALSAWEAMRNAGPVTRESLLAQANNGGRLTSGLRSGIDDPNFNRDGRFFQGAVPSADANGRVSFTTRAVADPGAAEREARRLQHMEQLRARQGGDRPPQPYLQRGTASLSSPSDLPQFANPKLQDQRKATLAERMGRVQERAATLASQRKENLAARQRGPSVMDMLMQRNPELAVRMQAIQQQGQIAQAQMQANAQIAQGGWKNALDVANAQGNQQLANTNALTKGNLDVANATGDFNMRVSDKQLKSAEARANAEQLASQNRLAAEQRAAGMGQYNLWAQANPNATPQQQNAAWQAFTNPPALAAGQPSGVPGGIVDRLQQPTGAVPQAPFGAAQGARDTTKPIYAGGKVNDSLLQELQGLMAEGPQGRERAFAIAVQQYGMTPKEAEDFLNSPAVYNSWFWNYKPGHTGYWGSIFGASPPAASQSQDSFAYPMM